MSTLAPPIYADSYLDVLELHKPPREYIPFYKHLLKRADTKLTDDFHAQAEVASLVRIRGWYVEQVIIQLWKLLINNDKLALVAVGGFGRGDLHPYSDVDLLIVRTKKSKKYDVQISQFIQALWDIGLDVGSSVRTVQECYVQARDSVTVATNLMEARFVLGNFKAFKQMRKLTSTKNIWKSEDFFLAKWQEQKVRHKKFS
ncbi:[Protein-PII] uridylyltransferase / [Protein-PII]-UMP uridylyl-removing enzyme, partial [hydrothermal vent metagenome]